MTRSKSLATSTSHTLPFDRLSPRDFERLCLWLVEREGFERAEHLGAAGSEQGRDIIAWREGALWAFQCKRARSFGPKDALAEVEKVLLVPHNERPATLTWWARVHLAHRSLEVAPRTFYRGWVLGCLARSRRGSVGTRTPAVWPFNSPPAGRMAQRCRATLHVGELAVSSYARCT